MALGPRLDLRQTQSLVMTPQLQQAIKLLQYSSLELAVYVETQIEQNPLLERQDGGAEDGGDREPSADVQTAEIPVDGDPRGVDEAVGGDDALSFGEAALDFDDYDNVYDATDAVNGTATGAFDGGARASRGGSFDDHDANIEEMLSSRPTLKEHLLTQFSIDIDDPADRIIGLHLIDLLDESGYLVGDCAAVAEMLGCPVERVEATLRCLQRFDPAGVFARSLAECLALQLADRGQLTAPMRIVLQHLELVARRDFASLARLAGVGTQTVMKLITVIRTLNPKPASTFDHAVAQPVIPDVLMRQQPNGAWLVELNSETLPRLLVNNQYYAQVSRSLRNRDERQYVNECLQSANWLVRSLHQRATTILKVATEIIRQQQGFFVNGVRALRPLILRDIAEAIGMHESTVSRVTANKFVATPRGIYELKYFFTHAVGAAAGNDGHAAEWVRQRIKALIDGESAGGVLSDDTIADKLQGEGIDIARRTVAKYREALGIPSSVQRRREKGC
jgi:RNA polymerase sigma-54 factor